MPQLGETVREGTISVWHKKVGDSVRTDEPLFEVETDKVTMDIAAPAVGVLAQILVPAGGRVEVGARIAVIWAEIADKAPAQPAASAVTATTIAAITSAATVRLPNPHVRLSPVVCKLLAEHRIDDLGAITGSGTDGRITRDDVLAYVAQRRGGQRSVPAEPTETVVPMSRIRKLTAEHMVRSVATSPHVLQAVEVDFFAVDRLRAEAAERWRAGAGFALSYLPFVARAVCRAIADFPHVNASVRGESLVVHHRVNLGIAIDLDRHGLIAPVIKDAAKRTVGELAEAIHRLAERARASALTPDDLTEGTYTLSNSGTFGTLITAPIIVQPQVAILSTDGVKKRAVVLERPDGDTIEIRPVGVLAHSFDHRAFDGAYSAAFLRRVKELLELGDFASELEPAAHAATHDAPHDAPEGEP
ncbi:MAG TPA: 2-oxo acid dehydrogenase subunit E2 [Kofleriaceae bacterium]|nr:2-oxo acid dehydrogenase subunit E2 [Kofleriaceae bacterium]